MINLTGLVPLIKEPKEATDHRHSLILQQYVILDDHNS